MRNTIVLGIIFYILWTYPFGYILGILFGIGVITFAEILRGYKKILNNFLYGEKHYDYIEASIYLDDRDIKETIKKIFKYDLTARKLAFGYIIKEHQRIKIERAKEETKSRQTSANRQQETRSENTYRQHQRFQQDHIVSALNGKKKCLETFNIVTDYTIDEIKKSFKQLAKKWHPDKFTDQIEKELAEIKFKEINECKDKLLKG